MRPYFSVQTHPFLFLFQQADRRSRHALSVPGNAKPFLGRGLSAHSFDSQISGENRTIFVRILPYLRFLDMQYRQRNDRISKFKRRNLALYNRVVWGVLYHETFPKLSYGFNDEVRNSIRQELEKSLNPQKS